ncbi:MAG TPA: ubiquinone biosynthesis hydroxylase [Xanthobacteraceae bacterium]|nr:ubiquinone biosynthesis hydroxylase [Xanthobacteraceae bacterium]
MPDQPGGGRCADVVIAGAGLAGLALGIALRQGLGSGFSVMVVDPGLGRAGRDERASAIAAAARRLFETIGVWTAIAADAQPIRDMVITDSAVADAVRPTFLSFAGDVAPGERFAHMIENARLIAALLAAARQEGVTLEAGAVTGFEPAGERVRVRLGDRAVKAQLLVAADGARSRLRALAGIPTYGWSYGQAAIVTTVGHERDHEGRAVEHFLPEGPFAILPLSGRRSSIVWTQDRALARHLMGLPEAAFLTELERRFGHELGEIRVIGPRQSYPLAYAVARSFIAERLALVGDAAHVIHPIAGQGLNLGLRDVAALAEAIADAARLGLDPGSPQVLARYQRWRRFDTVAMGVATDALNRLFSNRSAVLRLLRDVGLGLVDRQAELKQLFIREAAGLVGEVPRLMRGEAL